MVEAQKDKYARELATRDHYQYGRRSSARAAAQRSRGGGRSSGRGERPKAAADKDPGLHTPWFTYATMLACVGVFTYCMYLNDWTFEPTSINPLFGPSNQVLLDMGALSEPLVVNGGEWWRLFTPMVLHVGLIHLAFNMLSFYRVGGDLEMAFGGAVG